MEKYRDRLATACSAEDRYRGLGGDAVASLWGVAMSERQQEVEDASLDRHKSKYRATKDEYRRC